MKVRSAIIVVLLLACASAGLPVAADDSSDIPLTAVQAPLFWSPPPVPAEPVTTRTGLPVKASTTLVIGPIPLPLHAMTPCRQYDSRSSPPGTPLANATPRAVLMTGSPCFIPPTAQAVAVNITLFNIVDARGNGVFKAGNVSPPTTAWINYPPTETQRGNAGVLPLDLSHNLTVQVNQGAGSVDFVVDVAGYFAEPDFSQAVNGFCIGLDCRGSWNNQDIGSVSPLPRTCPVGQIAISSGSYQWQCGVVCAQGTADCDGIANNGCETNTVNSILNCGSCGTICSNNNIDNPICSNFVCNGSCNFGFADCDNNKQTNGCETNILTSINNCGACGLKCPGGLSCSGGICLPF